MTTGVCEPMGRDAIAFRWGRVFALPIIISLTPAVLRSRLVGFLRFVSPSARGGGKGPLCV